MVAYLWCISRFHWRLTYMIKCSLLHMHLNTMHGSMVVFSNNCFDKGLVITRWILHSKTAETAIYVDYCCDIRCRMCSNPCGKLLHTILFFANTWLQRAECEAKFATCYIMASLSAVCLVGGSLCAPFLLDLLPSNLTNIVLCVCRS